MVTNNRLVLARITVLLLLSAWVSAVSLRSYSHYREEMNLPPNSYADTTHEGSIDVAVMSHATAAANAFFVTVVARSIPPLSFGLSVFWLLGQLRTRSNSQTGSAPTDRPIRKFRLNDPE